MGFAWSSCVAQDTTVNVLVTTGLDEDKTICDTEPLPLCQRELAVVATDDVIFIHRDKEEGRERLHRFDQALKDHGIPRAQHKDENAQPDVVALGCELSSSPPRADPDSVKLWLVLNAVAELQRTGRASPRGVNSLLGVAQWFCILSRPHFSCFDAVYEFVRRTPENDPQTVPRKVLDELLLFAGLAPLLSAELDRQWCTTVVATDAAPEYAWGCRLQRCRRTP